MLYIRIAELLVEIDNRYDAIKERCKDYIVEPDHAPDICIKTTDDYLNQNIDLFEEKGLIERGLDRNDALLEQMENYCLHWQIYRYLPRFNAAWMHASVVEVDGCGYAFTAPSGYGKTTQSLLWLDYFGERARIINGDNPIIRLINDKFYAFGTPFCGSEGYNGDTSVPLKGVCYLNHSSEINITRMEPAMAFAQVMRSQETRSQETYAHQLSDVICKENEESIMTIWERIVQSVPFYQLYCDRSTDSVITAYLGMNAE